MDLSLVIPCYKEESHLEANIDRVLSTLRLLNVRSELIFVDDCSPDQTKLIIRKIISKFPEHSIKAIYHASNQGRGGAFISGVKQSSGKFVGFFDIDLEVSCAYLIEFVRILQLQNADMVIGNRSYELHFGLMYRHILSVCYGFLAKTLLRIPRNIDSESGYKFFKRETLVQYVEEFLYQGWFWDTEVVSKFIKDKRKVVSVPCLFIRNEKKVSTVKPVRDTIDYFIQLLRYRFSTNGFTKKTNTSKLEETSNKKAA